MQLRNHHQKANGPSRAEASSTRARLSASSTFSVINLMGRRTWPMKFEMTRTYRTSRGHLIYLALFSAGWFAFVIGTSAQKMPDQWTARDICAAFLAVLFALLPAYLTARIPHTVIVSDDGTCAFRSLIRSHRVRAQQIHSISYDEGDLTLELDRGALTMRAVDDMHGFLAQLVELNPALDLPRGWRAELDKGPNGLHEGPYVSEAEAQEVAGPPHQNFVLRFLSRMAVAALLVFMSGFLMTWLVHPVPGWVIPLMLGAFAVTFGSTCLYWAIAGFRAEEPRSDEPGRPGAHELREDAEPNGAPAQHGPRESRLQFAFWWIGLTFMSLAIYEMYFSDGHIDGTVLVDFDFTVEVLACALVGWLATRLILSAGRKGWIS
jgi:hypothetical protein